MIPALLWGISMLFKISKLENLLSGELDDSRVTRALGILGRYYAGYDEKDLEEHMLRKDYAYVLGMLKSFGTKEEMSRQGMKNAIQNSSETFNFGFGPVMPLMPYSMSPLHYLVSEADRLLEANRIMIGYLEKNLEKEPAKNRA